MSSRGEHRGEVHLFALGKGRRRRRPTERVYFDRRARGPFRLEVWTHAGSDRVAVIIDGALVATLPPGGGSSSVSVDWRSLHAVRLQLSGPGQRGALGGYRSSSPGWARNFEPADEEWAA